MADERSRRGLNPNAQAFIPNPAARPFIPGQPYVFTTQPPPMYHHPPPPVVQGTYPVYQQYGQMGSTNVAQHMAPPSVATPAYHQPVVTTAAPSTEMHLNAPPTQRVSSSQQQVPIDAWDDEADEKEEVIGRKEEMVKEEAIKNSSSLGKEEQEPVKPIDLETVKPENTRSKANNLPVAKEIDGEDAALSVKFKHAAYIDDSNRKEHVNMVFIGHVDAGKSTIGGHLMYLTGMVDKRTLEKYEREAKDKGRESWFVLMIDFDEIFELLIFTIS
uniref:Tr-type G domain-containing protein n=1 Tax=Wuchereria bancrofti TaxID=6293 RepID=A0A1I8EPL6_WUCBA